MCSDECLGENPKGFPTQGAALEREDQLRWVGGFSSRASLLLPLYDSLVIAISRVQAAFEGGGQVSLGQRAEGGRIVGGTVSDPRVVIDPSVGHKESTYSFCFARPSIASESQDLKLDFSSHTSDMTSNGGPWTLTRHDIYTASEH